MKNDYMHGTFGRSVSMLLREMSIGETVEFVVVDPQDDKVPSHDTCRATISEAARRCDLKAVTTTTKDGRMYVTRLDPNSEAPTAIALPVDECVTAMPPEWRPHYARFGYGKIQPGEHISIETNDPKKFMSSVRGHARAHGKKFTCRTTSTGVTVWRIK